MSQDYIEIRGARVHNLKNVDLRLPHNQLIVVTGVSGSGKSSLGFDTIYAGNTLEYFFGNENCHPAGMWVMALD